MVNVISYSYFISISYKTGRSHSDCWDLMSKISTGFQPKASERSSVIKGAEVPVGMKHGTGREGGAEELESVWAPGGATEEIGDFRDRTVEILSPRDHVRGAVGLVEFIKVEPESQRDLFTWHVFQNFQSFCKLEDSQTSDEFG